MESREALLALEEPSRQINDGINALGSITTGLLQIKDPYAEGLHAIWEYLDDANQELQKQTKICLEFV